MRILLVLVVCLFLVVYASEKTFYDTPNTYARYRKWIVKGVGTLRLSFKTYKSDALLLYTDGGPNSQDFLKIQLVNQQLVVVTDFGSGRIILEIGQHLADGDFHSIQINVKKGLMTVYLDDKYSKEQSFDNSATDNTLELNTEVYIGGVNRYDADLVEPDMPQEPRFAGCIKDFKFTRPGGENFGVPMTDNEEGTVEGCGSTGCDRRTTLDSCKNGGTCVPLQTGSTCNCVGTGYTGDKCTTAATVAKFQASEYIKFKAEEEPGPSKFDSLSFRLKTARANGLIFYYKSEKFFMSVEVIKNYLSVNVGFGTKQQQLTLDTQFVGDNTWHEVHIGRYESFLTLEVDNLKEQTNLANPSPVLYNKDIYIGGGENLPSFEGVRSKLNFVGCLQQLIFNKRQMLKEGKSEMPGYSVSGNLEWMCSEIQHIPVMFGSSESRLELDPWMTNRELTLQFKTTNPDGVLAFIGTDQKYLALELLDGEIIFSAFKDGRSYETRAGRDLADSKWHIVTARYDVGGISIHLYGDVGVAVNQEARFTTSGDMNFQTSLLLGTGDAGAPSLRSGYRGCMRGLSIRGEVIDLYTLLADQPPGVVAGCSSLAEACAVQPCYHGSVCNQEMNSYTCDCTGTGYEGAACSVESAALTFSGSQYLRYLTSMPTHHEVDTISFRFRTQAEKGLLMFVTSDYKYNPKYMYFELINGEVWSYLNFGMSQKRMKVGGRVSDGRWHKLHFTRDHNSITLQLDDYEVKHDIPGAAVEFAYQYTYLGSASKDEWMKITRLTKSRRSFDGCLQQAVMNGENLITTAFSAMIVSNARRGCKFQETTEQQVAAFVRPSYIRLPPWQFNKESSQLNFQFRTKEHDGLILFHGRLAKDYLAIELEQGRLIAHLKIGDFVRPMSSLISGLDNNVWHNVSLRYVYNQEIVFQVDGIPVTIPDTQTPEFTFLGGLYVGGAPDSINSTQLPYTIQSNRNFIGCVRALTVNNAIQDLLQAGNDNSAVRGQCEETCAAYPCKNGGSCRQLDNTYDCLCTGTFFKGKTCSDEMTRVRFAPGSSLSYAVYDHKTTIKDDLHIKFKTTGGNGGLVKIETQDPNQFFNIIIRNKYLEVSLKMGGSQIDLKSDYAVSDDVPHTVSIWRRNSEVSYSFDQADKQTLDLNVAGTVEFGVIMKILLSFSVNNKEFSGCILAFDYNGIRPLENTDLPNIEKSPGIIEGTCDTSKPTTVKPLPDDNDTDNQGKDGNSGNNGNHVDQVTPNPNDSNSTTLQEQRKSATRLGLPFIICIAIGGFLLILVITYGVSRFARRRQGVYKTNEEKRMTERIEYDKLSTIHDEAFELPPKRELYM